MSSVFKLALILLAAALLAVLARSFYVSSQKTPVVVEPDPRIRVAAADLPAGLLIRDADLQWQSISRDSVPKGAVVEGQSSVDVNGGLLRQALESGQPLLVGNIIRADSPGFLAAALKPGMRAVSVPVDDVSGNAGLIQPGDFVDILLTQRWVRPGGPGQAPKPQIASETVVQSARVIAVGSSFESGDGKSNQPNRARTITLELDSRTGEAVTVASKMGDLSLALRSFAVAGRDDPNQAARAQGASVVAWEGRPQAAPGGPVWGSDVSQVHRKELESSHDMDRAEPSAAEDSMQKPDRRPAVVTVMRGASPPKLVHFGTDDEFADFDMGDGFTGTENPADRPMAAASAALRQAASAAGAKAQ
ncbi:Flp pilus assembly protein CpaB [Castellaniella hirudinis]|uniref:Flp pilus assembly protein CpaB n=1 Tax=Castellaniella hirudinis TaxID=1144617 RepID=UPI0039C0C8ED